jgi:hypothetical protein
MKPLEVLRSSYLLFDEAVILFNHIIEVLRSPQFAIQRYYLFNLRKIESFMLSGVLINADGERRSAMIGSHHLLEEAFCCGNIAFSAQHEFDSLPR